MAEHKVTRGCSLATALLVVACAGDWFRESDTDAAAGAAGGAGATAGVAGATFRVAAPGGRDSQDSGGAGGRSGRQGEGGIAGGGAAGSHASEQAAGAPGTVWIDLDEDAQETVWAGVIVNGTSGRIRLDRVELVLYQSMGEARLVATACAAAIGLSSSWVSYRCTSTAELWPGNVSRFDVQCDEPVVGAMGVYLDGELVWGQSQGEP